MSVFLNLDSFAPGDPMAELIRRHLAPIELAISVVWATSRAPARNETIIVVQEHSARVAVIESTTRREFFASASFNEWGNASMREELRAWPIVEGRILLIGGAPGRGCGYAELGIEEDDEHGRN